MNHDARGDFPPRPADKTRRTAMRLHPASHVPTTDQVPAGEQELLGRWDRLHAVLVRAGLTDNEARTEVARIAAGGIWDECADGLKEHRAAARQEDARAFAVALRSIQGAITPLTLRPGDLTAAKGAVTGARRRLQHNRGLFERRLHRTNPVLERTGRAFTALEAFLNPHRPEPPARFQTAGAVPAAA